MSYWTDDIGLIKWQQILQIFYIYLFKRNSLENQVNVPTYNWVLLVLGNRKIPNPCAMWKLAPQILGDHNATFQVNSCVVCNAYTRGIMMVLSSEVSSRNMFLMFCPNTKFETITAT